MPFDAFSLDLHNKSIGHLLGRHGINFAPPPKKKKNLEKKWTIYLLYFVYIFDSNLLSKSYF